MSYYVFSGGGTSGHINPALAIIESLKEKYPDDEILYIGKQDGLEASLIPEKQIDFVGLNLLPLSPIKPSIRLFKALSCFFKSKRQCIKLFKEKRPDMVIGTGGYVAAPVLAAAHKLNIPILVHEQNAFMGRTNRYLLPKAASFCVSYKEALLPFLSNYEKNLWQTNSSLSSIKNCQEHHIVHTGQPLRQDFLAYVALAEEERNKTARSLLGYTQDDYLVLAIGGSLGARNINRAFIDFFCEISKQKTNYRPEKFKKDVYIILGTGSFLLQETKEYAEEKGLVWQQNEQGDLTLLYDNGEYKTYLQLKPYLHNLSSYLAAANWIVSRSGAGSVFEILALAKTSCLVPYPYAIMDHQMHNARALEQQKLAYLYKDADFNKDILHYLFQKASQDFEKFDLFKLSNNKNQVNYLKANDLIIKEIEFFSKNNQ